MICSQDPGSTAWHSQSPGLSLQLITWPNVEQTCLLRTEMKQVIGEALLVGHYFHTVGTIKPVDREMGNIHV